MRTFLREVLITVILALVIFLILHTTVQSFVVVGSSMEPNFQNGERLVTNKLVYKLHQPERGEVIIFHPPNNQQTDYIKRVIALPGDSVEVKNGAVYVNGTKLDEPYIKELPAYTMDKRKIPENEYFVLGDNRNNSNDSHTGWAVPRQNIIGKAWLVFWPPNGWGMVHHYPLDKQLASSSASSWSPGKSPILILLGE
jgi:signal peptidase I